MHLFTKCACIMSTSNRKRGLKEFLKENCLQESANTQSFKSSEKKIKFLKEKEFHHLLVFMYTPQVIEQLLQQRQLNVLRWH